MSYCKGGGGGVVVCFNSGTLQEGQLSFHGDQTSNISTDQTKKKEYFSGSRPTNGDNFLVKARAEVELPRPAVKVLRAQLSYDKRRTLHIRSIVL